MGGERKGSWRDEARLVFRSPEADGSNIAKRNVVDSPKEHDEITRAHVLSTLAWRALPPEVRAGMLEEFVATEASKEGSEPEA